MSLEKFEKTEFYEKVRATYGSYIGASIASNATRYLSAWGLDPATLQPLDAQGHNSLVFSNGQIAIKVTTELERFGQLPSPPTPQVLRPLAVANLGYDQGQAAISLEAYPLLQTQGVTSEHVKALCHDLYTKHGLIFRDNKTANVGLSSTGLPYVIDAGSLIELRALPKGEAPFLYTEHSGMTLQGMWEEKAKNHGFNWPESQKELPEAVNAASCLTPAKAPSQAKG